MAWERREFTNEEVEFVWTLLERDARASADAGFLLYVLYREDGGDALREGWTKFGCGQQWLDWWLVQRPLPRRALEGNDYFLYLDIKEETELRAVAKRPEILSRIVHARLHHLGVSCRLKHRDEPVSIRHIKDIWLWWEENADLETQPEREMPSMYGYHDSDAGRFRYLPVWVNRLRWCYWLFGRRNDVTKVTGFTWKHEYLAFRKWLTENEVYLRFHEKDLQFKVDQEAKKQGRMVLEVERAIPTPKTPFSDWEGTTPEAYDH